MDEENNALREQLQKMGDLTAENQRLSELLLETNAASAHATGITNPNTIPGGDRAELTRLRREIEQLSQQTNQVAMLRADTLATAEALQQAHDAHRTNRTSRAHTSAASSSFEVLSAT